MRTGPPAAALAVSLTLTSCVAPQTGPDGSPPEAPSYSTLASAQNRRAALLQTFYSRGTVDMTWFDEQGREDGGQGSIDLWVDWPRCLAMQVTKLGEELAWLGGDETHRWLFALSGDERVLHVGPHSTRAVPDGQPLELSPHEWRDLLGLSPMPTAEDGPESWSEPPVGWDERLDAWVVETSRSAGTLRRFLDRTTGLPRRIELHGPNGALLAHSEHHHHRVLSVTQAGRSVLEWPKIANPIDVHQPDGSFVKVSLSEPTGIVDDQPFDRVCDLDRLIEAFRPDRIEGELP